MVAMLKSALALEGGFRPSSRTRSVHVVPRWKALMLDARELSALLGEASHIVTQGLAGLLATPFEVSGVPRAHVCALEIAHEGPDQVIPVMD